MKKIRTVDTCLAEYCKGKCRCRIREVGNNGVFKTCEITGDGTRLSQAISEFRQTYINIGAGGDEEAAYLHPDLDTCSTCRLYNTSSCATDKHRVVCLRPKTCPFYSKVRAESIPRDEEVCEQCSASPKPCCAYDDRTPVPPECENRAGHVTSERLKMGRAADVCANCASNADGPFEYCASFRRLYTTDFVPRFCPFLVEHSVLSQTDAELGAGDQPETLREDERRADK